jgi:hypothetical protein
MNNFQELTDFLDKYHVKYIIHSDCVEVEGDLYLKNKNLTSLPESFGNLKIGGSLWLENNNLTSLPESFGNLKIGGDTEMDEIPSTQSDEIPSTQSDKARILELLSELTKLVNNL